jgi:hypothetical protein
LNGHGSEKDSGERREQLYRTISHTYLVELCGVIVPANTCEEEEKEAGMIISQELLRETEKRYKERE